MLKDGNEMLKRFGYVITPCSHTDLVRLGRYIMYQDNHFYALDTHIEGGSLVYLGFDADRHEYSTKLFTMAQTLKSVQSENGCWGASLMNATAFPGPETTGTANFCYALAYGVRTGILDRSSFLPTVEKAWQRLSKTALQPSGLVGYCQPCGGAPNATTAAETSDFCVGQFLLAATEVARLSEALVAEEGA